MITLVISTAFTFFPGPDERLQDCEYPLGLWSVISEDHLTSQHPDGYVLLIANKSSEKINK